MQNIGKRIKDLRKQNDLTQEKLANLLGVTDKAVSKWECGATMPDLALIVPMARLLKVSTDVLLGNAPPEQDERKRYFDEEYFDFWNKDDHEADYLIAMEAVAEYPGDYRYLHWLGTVEYYIAFRHQEQADFLAAMDESIAHNLLVYENAAEEELKSNALWTVICAYRYSGRIAEAKKYAEMYPEGSPTTRNDALEMCLQGEELLILRQEMISDALANLCSKLEKHWRFESPSLPRTREAVLATKTIIETVIPDGNYHYFHFWMQFIHEKLSDIAQADGDPALAVEELSKALYHASERDRSMTGGKHPYTCPILDHYNYDFSSSRPIGSCAEYMKTELREQKRYDPLRGREDFKALLN